jgi:ATP-dependent DNA ligase
MIFAHASKLGLEGIVCKRRDLLYRSGRSKARIKVKNARWSRRAPLRCLRFFGVFDMSVAGRSRHKLEKGGFSL